MSEVKNQITYQNIPFLAFFECLANPDALKKYGYDKDDFEAIKDEWHKKNPVDSEEFHLYKKSFQKTCYVNICNLLLARYQIDPNCGELFIELGLPWPIDDPVAFLKKEISKDRKTIEYTNREVMRLIEENQGKESLPIDKLHDAIASVQAHGFQTGKFNEYLLCEYEAHGRMIEMMQEKQKQNG